MLYPLLFHPLLKPILWGGDAICKFKEISPLQQGIGESWEISHVKNNVSVVDNGALKNKTLDDLIREYGEQLLGKKVVARFGSTFPLLIKFIDARDDLSIQVHPNDELANKRHNSFGKTEMWYLINAKPGAFLYSGFAQQLTPGQYIDSVANNTFTGLLDKHEVKPGDVFFLPAGRVHAIGAGCFLAEIQQTSDITYRIYDFNRKDAGGNPRELHTELAKDAIDYTVYPDHKLHYTPEKGKEVPLVSCDYFTTKLIETDRPMHIELCQRDSFSIFICMEGKWRLTDANGYSLELHQGQTVLVPADCSSIAINPYENCKLLETFL